MTVASKTAKSLRLKSGTLARGTVRCNGAGSRTVTLKPSAKVRRALAAARGSVKVTLGVRLRAVGEADQKSTSKLTLARR